jgi:protein-tyrosine-phosphatase
MSELWIVEADALCRLRPRHLLFLCVANSARSQLAEGIARSLAPEHVKISSAGSVPTSVRLQTIEVLREIGIDISHHTSTGLDEVERPVDAVITLCAEQVCPVWCEHAWRAHWGLPDPAEALGCEEVGFDEANLEAFRLVRDELLRRLGVVFASTDV